MKRALITTTALVAFATAAGGVAAQEADDDSIYPPEEEQELDASAFSGVCEDDAPFVDYEIEPIGFEVTDDTTATLTIRDVEGTLVEVREDMPLSGSFIYPGAAVDQDGNATDWPGWELVDGVWVELGPDEGDTILREGLDIQVDVNPTAFTDVDYPDADPQCSGPQVSPPDREDPDEEATPQGIANPPTQADSLPATGSGPQPLLFAGALALVAGLIFLIAAHRRRTSDATPA